MLKIKSQDHRNVLECIKELKLASQLFHISFLTWTFAQLGVRRQPSSSPNPPVPQKLIKVLTSEFCPGASKSFC